MGLSFTVVPTGVEELASGEPREIAAENARRKATAVAGSLVLAPAIVFGYAVKAADRADRDGSWE